VVTGYTQSLVVSRSLVTPARLHHTPRGRSRDGKGAPRDQSRGHRPRSPGASLERPPTRRGCYMPPAISCASMSLHTRSDGSWGTRRPVRQPGNGMNSFLEEGLPWQRDSTGCGPLALGPQKQGQTPDLEAFLRGGTVFGKELAGCKPRDQRREAPRPLVAPERVRFSRELDRVVLRAERLSDQNVSGTPGGERESRDGNGTMGVRPGTDPGGAGVESSGGWNPPIRVHGTRRNGQPSRWGSPVRTQHPASAWPRPPSTPAPELGVPTVSLQHGFGTIKRGLNRLDPD